MKIEVYTDGSATTSDKPGGYGWVIVIDGKFHSEGSGGIPNATNNDAELEAAIMGLANVYKLKPTEPVTLVSDSQIILNWINGTSRFKQMKKIQKYEAIKRLKKMMVVHTRWVEGHAGHEWNERCDKLAGAERKKAMGIEPKASKTTLRNNYRKRLKLTCEKLAEVLEFIKNEINVDPSFYVSPNRIKDKVDEALKFYKENI